MFYGTFNQQIDSCSFQTNVFSSPLLSINEMQILKLISPQERKNNDDQNTFRAHECFRRDFWRTGLQLLLVQKIINIQFFITQSNTDASIIEASRRFIIAWSLLHLCIVKNKNKNFFSVKWFMWLCEMLCRAVEQHVYWFSPRQCHGNCNKSSGCCFPPFTFWLKCKCKFAHETDGSCNKQQTIFPGFEGKGNQIPSTSRSVELFPALQFGFSYPLFLCWKNYFIEDIFAISPAHNLMHHANFNQLNECNIFLPHVYNSLAYFATTMHKHNVWVVKRENKTSDF